MIFPYLGFTTDILLRKLENFKPSKYYLQSVIFFSTVLPNILCWIILFLYKMTSYKQALRKYIFESPNTYGNTIKNSPTTEKPAV